MKLKQVRQVLRALLGAMAACLLLGAVLAGPAPMVGLYFAALGTVLFFVFIAFNFSRWRCPHCGEYLGRDLGEGIQLCPHCLERLDL